MDKDALKKSVCEHIDCNRDGIVGIGRLIAKIPEMGFKEFKTAELVKNEFRLLGLDFTDGIAVTGVTARAKGRKSLAAVAVMGELDAVLCASHPDADPKTGVVHACGHNAQIAAMLGAAVGLAGSGAMAGLDGDAVFMAVPGEEYVELEYRKGLRDKGGIAHLSGKQEFLKLGVFDDVDMAMMVHARGETERPGIFTGGASTGFISKAVRFVGKAAHASAPHEGINALTAANNALALINSVRETFRNEDRIVIHPIITKGGELINVVPADVRMEMFIRGVDIGAVLSASEKVDRAVRAGAYAVGAEVTITDMPGYLPLEQDGIMDGIFAANAAGLLGSGGVRPGGDMTGSTDAGDLSLVIPVIHPNTGGFRGRLHGADFGVADGDAAYIVPAKVMAMTVVDLLYNGAEKALEVKNNFRPKFTKAEYLEMLRGMDSVKMYKDL